MTAAHGVREQTYVARNLKPLSNYVFLVRANNSHGLGLPSQASIPVRTKGMCNAARYRTQKC